MADLLSAFIGFGGVVIGLLALPIQEWVRYIFNKRKDEEKKLITIIEEAYYLVDSLKEMVRSFDPLIWFFISQRNGTEMPKQLATKDPFSGEKSFKKLLFILEFQLRMPTENLNHLKDFDENLGQIPSILLHKDMGQVIKDTFGLEKTAENPIQEIIEQYNNDSVAAASALRKHMESNRKQLKIDIEKFLLEKYPRYKAKKNDKDVSC